MEAIGNASGVDVRQHDGKRCRGPLRQALPDLTADVLDEARQFGAQAVLHAEFAGTAAGAEDHRRRFAVKPTLRIAGVVQRSEEHTSELQSLMRISYAVFCLKQKTLNHTRTQTIIPHTSP